MREKRDRQTNRHAVREKGGHIDRRTGCEREERRTDRKLERKANR